MLAANQKACLKMVLVNNDLPITIRIYETTPGYMKKKIFSFPCCQNLNGDFSPASRVQDCGILFSYSDNICPHSHVLCASIGAQDMEKALTF